MVRLLSLPIEAPAIVIEGERANLMQRIMDFPVDPESMESRLQAKREREYEEVLALKAAGYYDTLCGPDSSKESP